MKYVFKYNVGDIIIYYGTKIIIISLYDSWFYEYSFLSDPYINSTICRVFIEIFRIRYSICKKTKIIKIK